MVDRETATQTMTRTNSRGKERTVANVVEQWLAEKTKDTPRLVDVVDIMQGAELLGIGMESMRRLEWNGAFGKMSEHRRPGRKGVLIPKKAVLAYQATNRGSTQGGGVSRTARGQQVFDAVALVAGLLLQDKEVTDKTFRDKVNTLLTKYDKYARTAIG